MKRNASHFISPGLTKRTKVEDDFSLQALKEKIDNINYYIKMRSYKKYVMNHFNGLLDYLDENFLKNIFVNLGKTISIRELIKNLLIQCYPFYLSESIAKNDLSWCDCGNAAVGSRIIYILWQLDEISKLYPNKNDLLVHTEFGEHRCLQTYLFCYGLTFLGYKRVIINVVGMSDYCIYNAAILIRKLSFFNKNFIFNIYPNGIKNLLNDIKKGRVIKSNSFSMVDAEMVMKRIDQSDNNNYINKMNFIKINIAGEIKFKIFIREYDFALIESNKEDDPLALMLEGVVNDVYSRYFNKEAGNYFKAILILEIYRNLNNKCFFEVELFEDEYKMFDDFYYLIKKAKQDNPIIFCLQGNMVKKYKDSFLSANQTVLF